MGVSLQSSGFVGATGAEQVVPGQLVMFGFFVAGAVGFMLFREHGWKTWDRLRASAATPTSLLAGFAVPWIVIHLCYQISLYVAGALLLGLRPGPGTWPALFLVMLGYAACVIAFILVVASSFRTIAQVSALQNVGAILFGGLGGALVPLDQLPAWARFIAPATPSYWAMRGHNAVLLEAGGIVEVLPSVGVLLGASVVLGFLAIRRFRVDETKEFFA